MKTESKKTRSKKRTAKTPILAKRLKEIVDYDNSDTSTQVDTSRPLQFADLGLQLPPTPPTQVVSIRLPSALLNEIRAMSSQRDIPYQAMIKLFLASSVEHARKKSA